MLFSAFISVSTLLVQLHNYCFFFLISTEDGSWPLSAQEVFLRRPLVASLLGHEEPREQ